MNFTEIPRGRPLTGKQRMILRAFTMTDNDWQIVKDTAENLKMPISSFIRWCISEKIEDLNGKKE